MTNCSTILGNCYYECGKLGLAKYIREGLESYSTNFICSCDCNSHEFYPLNRNSEILMKAYNEVLHRDP
jgi:hypothetical protein